MIVMGDRLRLLREKMNLTQEELSKKVGIKRDRYAKYETGVTPVPGELVIKFARLFKVSSDYLYGLTDDPAPPRPKKKEPTPEERALGNARSILDATARIAGMYNRGEIDIEENLRLTRLAANKFPPQSAKGAPKAAHLKVDMPGTGVFEEE